MTSLINYMVEANVGLLLIVVFYKLILKQETNFKLTRLFLLGGILVSLVFPLLHIGSPQQNSMPAINDVMPGNWLPEVIITGKFSQSELTSSYPAWKIVAGVYWAGVLLFMTVLFMRVIFLVAVMRFQKAYRLGKLQVVESVDNKPTFSFFNFIYIGNSGELTSYEKERILHHETVHARQLHSLDILLVNLLGVFFWFNPFIKAYKKIFVQLHEFEADARAVENEDADRYCNLLARVALQSADFKLANHFNNSLTLKRIEMIRSIKVKTSQWKLAALIAYVPAMFFLLACQEQVFAQKEKPKAEMSSSNEVFSEVDEMPTYAGGFESMVSFISGNLKYPKEARKKGIEGTVHIEFIVEKTGELSNFKMLHGIGAGCDEAALSTVKSMPDWIPGEIGNKVVRTKIVLPVKFKL